VRSHEQFSISVFADFSGPPTTSTTPSPTRRRRIDPAPEVAYAVSGSLSPDSRFCCLKTEALIKWRRDIQQNDIRQNDNRYNSEERLIPSNTNDTLCVCVRERERESVCVCVREREIVCVREKERERDCVCERERESERLCVTERERERESVTERVCLCCVRERERESVCV
jgi:hypothetical protein